MVNWVYRLGHQSAYMGYLTIFKLQSYKPFSSMESTKESIIRDKIRDQHIPQNRRNGMRIMVERSPLEVTLFVTINKLIGVP